jgi:hypothetical protein
MVIDYLLMLVFLAVSIYVYVGFFFPDPRLIRPIVKVFQHAAFFVFPIFIIGILLLYFRVRAGRTHLSTVILVGTSLVLCFFLAYPFISYFYDTRYFRHKIDQFHPYLQLSPNDFKKRQSEGGVIPLRIMCLGGSTTEFTDKNGHGWPHYLEKRLKDGVSGRPVEVYNLGRQWYTSLHTLINYAVNLRQHHPDVIIVMHAYNDLIHNADFCYFSFGSFKEDYRHFHGPVYRLINRPTFLDTAFLVAKSMWYHSPRDVINTDNFPGLVPFERNLRTLIDLARLDEVKVVLMTQPYLIKKSMTPAEKSALRMINFETVGPTKKWGYYTAIRAFEEYNNVVRKVSQKETGVYLIDLEPLVPKSLEYFWDDIHYQKKTFDFIAECISEKFRELNILSP